MLRPRNPASLTPHFTGVPSTNGPPSRCRKLRLSEGITRFFTYGTDTATVFTVIVLVEPYRGLRMPCPNLIMTLFLDHHGIQITCTSTPN